MVPALSTALLVTGAVMTEDTVVTLVHRQSRMRCRVRFLPGADLRSGGCDVRVEYSFRRVGPFPDNFPELAAEVYDWTRRACSLDFDLPPGWCMR